MNKVSPYFQGCALIMLLVLANACTSGNQENTSPLNLSPAGKNSSLPNLGIGPDNTITLSWIEERDSMAFLYYAFGSEAGWNEPLKIDSSVNWFINWADYPSVTIGQNGKSAAHVLEYNGKKTYDYNIQMYTNSGNTWDKFLLNTDGIPAEHGFVSMVPYDTNFFVSWLDGRNASSTNKNDQHAGHHGSMSLRAGIISNSGERISEWEVDARTCDCCQTAAVITSTGPIIFYRDRSESEIRDISVSRLVNGSWTMPKTIHEDNWMIQGCPVNGPRAFALGKTVAVAWYSESNNEPAVYCSISKDDGINFSQPVRIDTGQPLGRVDITGITENEFLISWVQEGKIMARIASINGIVSQPKIIAETSAVRSSGFPQLTASGNQIVFAWTDSKTKQVKTMTFTRKEFDI